MPQSSAMNFGLTGVATADLGLGGMLRDQVADETEEQRKKRMLELQNRTLMGGSLMARSGSSAVTDLLGARGGFGGYGA